MESIILKVLILGGTSFLGPHLVHELQEKGHKVTLFNRGNKSVEFADVEQLKGDRDGGLDVLKGRKWDLVIDTSGHLPRVVQDSADLLAESADHYTFISTIGVYQDFLGSGIDEGYPVAKLEDEKSEEITEKSYGALKAGCEKVVEKVFAGKTLIIRPGLIVGPLDPTGRFNYWPMRMEKGGEILAPGSPDQPVQFIDVRDLAKWIVAMAERRATGVFNATGPSSVLTLGELLKACQKASKKPSEMIWVSEEFLEENKVQDWSELPLWLSSKRKMPGFMKANIEKAKRAGLTFRPLEETLQDIVAWEKKRDEQESTTLSSGKEEKLLSRWSHLSL